MYFFAVICNVSFIWIQIIIINYHYNKLIVLILLPYPEDAGVAWYHAGVLQTTPISLWSSKATAEGYDHSRILRQQRGESLTQLG